MPVNLPQLRIAIAGAPIVGAISLELESVAYFAADRFTLMLANGANTAFFVGLDAQTITIDIALSLAGYQNLIIGQIDNVRMNLLDNTVTLSGRDLSAQLIDTEISQTFVNQTSSQIATTIATRHNLMPNISATETPVGQYYEIDHARSALGLNSRSTTEWNLLSQLAQLENFIVAVAGTTLTFGPQTATGILTVLSPQCFMALTLDIATTIPTSTTVKSWNTRNKAVVAQMAGETTGNSTTLIRPNLTTAQATIIAANHLAILARHSTILTGIMPGETSLVPTSQIMLAGTGSQLDQTYTIEAIKRSINTHSGFTQTIYAYAVPE